VLSVLKSAENRAFTSNVFVVTPLRRSSLVGLLEVAKVRALENSRGKSTEGWGMLSK